MKSQVVITAWFLSMAALGSWIAVMAADRRPATEYIGTPIIVPDPVEDGGRIVVSMPVKRNRDCPGIVHRFLRNADNDVIVAYYDPVPTAFPFPVDMKDRLPKTFELPEGMPPRVTYESKVCFHCNLLQQWFPICTSVPPVTFSVIQKTPAR